MYSLICSTREKMMTTDIFAEMEADAVDASVIPKDTELSGVAAIAQKQLELEADVARTEDYLKQLKKDLEQVSTRDLPDALMELGLSGLPLADGTVITIKPFVSASISKNRQEEAHTWLNNNGHGDLIKNIISVNTGKDAEAADLAYKALADVGFAPDTKESVHSQTLKAFVREQVEAGTALPLELFGVFLGQKATIKKGS